jgi:hypothetical protein
MCENRIQVAEMELLSGEHKADGSRDNDLRKADASRREELV